MAYQNVGTPRFYIDIPSYLSSLGYTVLNSNEPIKFLNLNPDIQKPIIDMYNFIEQGYIFTTINLEMEFKDICNPDKFFVALLNHNFGTYPDVNLELEFYVSNANAVLNAEGVDSFQFNNNGSSIIIGEHDPAMDYFLFRFDNQDALNFQLGCLSFGSYYDMPHSPELDVTMTIENDGFDAITTQGGAHLTNIRYNGAPMWERIDGTQVPPWTIGEPTAVGRRRGRRVWSMNFKYLSDKDLFASNYMSNTYTENSDGYDSADLDTDADGNEVFYYNLDNDDSFHAQVLNKIGNGQRFIFQPDNTNNNPDQFAICQLDQDSLNIKQVANGVYDISLKITEVW